MNTLDEAIADLTRRVAAVIEQACEASLTTNHGVLVTHYLNGVTATPHPDVPYGEVHHHKTYREAPTP